MRFFSPQFFWLLPLAAIPFIIHLLSRLRLRRKDFPSLLLLQTVRRERFSWLRLKEIILLVLRTLTLLLLLFALTRPYLPVRSPGFLRT
ncbi:MAG: BatA domain-containing protein, partial [candidate division WOR-3 bacterium]